MPKVQVRPPDEWLAKCRWTHCATPGVPMTAPCRVRERRKAGAASLDAATRAIEGRVIGRGDESNRRPRHWTRPETKRVWQLLSCQNESAGQRGRMRTGRVRTAPPDALCVEDASLDTSEGPRVAIERLRRQETAPPGHRAAGRRLVCVGTQPQVPECEKKRGKKR